MKALLFLSASLAQAQMRASVVRPAPAPAAPVVAAPLSIVSVPASVAAPRLTLPVLTVPIPLSAAGSAVAPEVRASAEESALAKLDAAGFDRELADRGLILWRLLRASKRSGERAYLTIGLPPDGRPYDRKEPDPRREKELKTRLEASEKDIAALAARILGLPEENVSVRGDLAESCCGAGCQGCLRADPEQSEKWTDSAPFRRGKRR
ncbi:MAG: hypothetical protein HYZ75_13900 [Elusimicrobia bacterium]|nr:hypothetical protein [Elusimicrobiota bacterium]